MKRILAIFLSIALFAGIALVPISAETTAIVGMEAPAADMYPGSEVVLPVFIENNPGFTNFEWNIVYDTTRLELKSIDTSRQLDMNGTLIDVPYMPGMNVVSNTATGRIASAAATAYTGNGTLFTLTFGVKADAPTGLAEVKVVSDCFYNLNDAITAQYNTQGVNVVGTPELEEPANLPSVKLRSLSESITRGEDVTVEVSLSDNPGFTNFEWNIKYDTTRLELKSINTSSEYALNGSVVNIPYIPHSVVTNVSRGYITAAAADPYTEDGVLFTLTFGVKNDAPEGVADVTIESDLFYNVNTPIEATYGLIGIEIPEPEPVATPVVTVDSKLEAVISGETFTLYVFIADNPGFTNFEWNIVYDTTRLELKSIDTSRQLVMNGTLIYNTVTGLIIYAAATAYTGNGILFTLTFHVKEGAPAGPADVTIISDNFKNNETWVGTWVDAEFVAGTITIAGETEPEVEPTEPEPVATPVVTVENLDAAVSEGDEFTLDVSIADNPGFTNFEWTVVYDTERLELISIDEKYMPGMTVVSNTVTGRVISAATTAYAGNGTLFTLTFDVKEGAPAGPAEVKIVSDCVYNVNDLVTVEYVAGGVNVINDSESHEPVSQPCVNIRPVSENITRGEDVTVEVSLSDNPGFTNFEWNIKYDTTRLELKSINTSSEYALNGSVVNIPYIPHSVVTNVSRGYITAAAADPYTEDGVLFTLTFGVKDDAPEGVADVTIESDLFYNVNTPIEATYGLIGIEIPEPEPVATPVVTVESLDAAVSEGDEFTLDVSIADNPGFTNFEWTVVYDTERLELISIDEKYMPGMTVVSNTATGRVISAATTAYAGNGTLFTLTFDVKEGAPAGPAEVKIISDCVYNINELLSFSYITGGANVTLKPQHIEGEPVIENVVNATCVSDGNYDSVVYCTICGEELSRETVTVTAAGHTAGEPVAENNVDATCTVDGSYDNVVYCTVCEEEVSRETVTVTAAGHTAGKTVVENNVDTTCTVDGSYDNVVYCTVCEEEVSRETVTVTAAGHTAGEPVVENNVDATCTVDGSYDSVVYCTVCEEEISRETVTVTASGKHSGGEATCMAQAICSECKQPYGEKNVDNHTGNTHVENAKAENCGEDGYTGDTVCECGVTVAQGVIIPAAGEHNWDNGVVTAPTCEQDGTTVYTCSVCGTAKTDTVSALGHEWASWADIGESDDKDVHQRVCKRDGCGVNEFSDHAWNAWTSVNSTNHMKICAVCSGVRVADHVWDSGKELKPATITQTGVMIYTCYDCLATKTEVIPKIVCDHTWSEWNADNSVYHIRVCENGNGCTTYQQQAHQWDKGVVTSDPTETEEGVKTYTCLVCGYEKTESVAMLQHTHEFGEWTSDGTNTHTRRCENGNICTAIETSEHICKSWVDNNDGMHISDCSVCGAKITEAHTWNNWVMGTDENLYIRTCKCGATEEMTVQKPISDVVINTTDTKDNDAKAELVNGTAEELFNTVLSNEEQVAVAGGNTTVSVYLEVSDVPVNQVSSSVKAVVEAVIEGSGNDLNENAEVGMYLDINLFKEVTTTDESTSKTESEQSKITETSGNVTISIQVPDEMINTDSSVERIYKIIRIHESDDGSLITDVIEGVFDLVTKMFTFETDKFSTYVLVAEDIATGDVNGDGVANSDDAVAILRYLAGYDSTGYDIANGDFNSDGNTNSDDAVAILRMLAGYAD